jgi:hypothetical protein
LFHFSIFNIDFARKMSHKIHMRKIEITNGTYALVWALAIEQDQSEEDILRRVLAEAGVRRNALIGAAQEEHAHEPDGFVDQRFGVYFKPGFCVFRTYKGQNHRASVIKGKWYLDQDPTAYTSLSALSAAIGAHTENAWVGWRYIAEDGKQHLISDLRDPSIIRTRRGSSSENE